MSQKRIDLTPRVIGIVTIGVAFIAAAIVTLVLPGYASAVTFVLGFTGIVGISLGIRAGVRR